MGKPAASVKHGPSVHGVSLFGRGVPRNGYVELSLSVEGAGMNVAGDVVLRCPHYA